MKTSDRGLMALIGHEGVVQSRYKDAVGVWTIGVGHTAAAGAPDPAKMTAIMPMREVFDLLRKDAAKYEAGVNKAVKVALEQHEFDALVSWHFNTGRINNTKSPPAWLADLNAGRKKAAGEKLRNSIVTAGGKRLQALVDRRAAESTLFLHGTYPKPVAMRYPATPQGKVLWGKGERVDLIRALQINEKPAGALQEQDAPSVAPKPETAPVTPAGGNGAIPKLLALIVVSGTAALAWLANLPCELTGYFCG